MDPHFLMNMEEDSLSFPPYYLENYEWGKKISKFERKSMSHTKLLQHLSYFLSLPFTEWRSRVRGQIRNVRSAMNSFSGRSNPARVASGVPV